MATKKVPRNRVRCVMVGDGAAGKTYAAIRYTTGVLANSYTPTVSDSWMGDTTVDGKIVQLELCDTPGQEDYDRNRITFYNKIDVALIVFSFARKDSLDNISVKWFPEIGSFLKGVPIVLAGMQKDRIEDVAKNDPLNSIDEEHVRQLIRDIKPVA